MIGLMLKARLGDTLSEVLQLPGDVAVQLLIAVQTDGGERVRTAKRQSATDDQEWRSHADGTMSRRITSMEGLKSILPRTRKQ